MALKFQGGKAVPTNPTERPRVKAAMEKVEPMAREFKATGMGEMKSRVAYSMHFGPPDKVRVARGQVEQMASDVIFGINSLKSGAITRGRERLDAFLRQYPGLANYMKPQPEMQDALQKGDALLAAVRILVAVLM